jgi:hypothetical protein
MLITQKMTVGQFLASDVLVRAFSSAKVVDTGRRFREVWPDFPSGKRPINNYEAGYFIYVLSACNTAGKKEVYDAIKKSVEFHNSTVQKNPVVALGDLLAFPEKIDKVFDVTVSRKNGWMTIHYKDRPSIQFPDEHQIMVSQDRATIDRHIEMLHDAKNRIKDLKEGKAGYDFYKSEITRIEDSIANFEKGIRQRNEQFGFLDIQYTDVITILKPSFLKAVAEMIDAKNIL